MVHSSGHRVVRTNVRRTYFGGGECFQLGQLLPCAFRDFLRKCAAIHLPESHCRARDIGEVDILHNICRPLAYKGGRDHISSCLLFILPKAAAGTDLIPSSLIGKCTTDVMENVYLSNISCPACRAQAGFDRKLCTQDPELFQKRHDILLLPLLYNNATISQNALKSSEKC
jgi:hypothetical protein